MKRTPAQHREAFRRFARKVININDPLFLATELARARDGKMSPQEKAKYIDAAYHLDVEERPAPPPVAIQIVNKFADGTSEDKTYVVTGDAK